MEYPSLNDLVRDLKLDNSHWINIEAKKFRKESTYRDTSVNIKHIPHALINEKVKCKNEHTFKIKWLEKKYPTSIFLTKRGLLRQESCNILCPICKQYTPYTFKLVKYKGDIDIYGDEAFRDIDNKRVFVYTFIYFTGKQDKKENFEKHFLELKKKLAPSIEPTEWTLHMKDIISSDKRRKIHYLAHLTYQDIIKYIQEILKLISVNSKKDRLKIFSAIGISNDIPRNHKEEILYKEEIYSAMLMHMINDITGRGYAPKFYFERTKKDGWAKNIFDGGRLTLLWSRITYGIPVMSPKFVEPSYSMYLELADLVSYIMGRYLYSIGSKVKGEIVIPDFNPSEIGKVNYLITNGNGDTHLTISDHFPNDKIFSGTDWEFSK